ncbi:hypothetical protein [Desulfonatronum lacustre]|uniref:hypothetical protein n=1 Tax=Desulfonatronum lacustre TaxID=66849 RepID=UPI000491E3F5|nr:hypothetical protein [Desulfonatronum lacustre]
MSIGLLFLVPKILCAEFVPHQESGAGEVMTMETAEGILKEALNRKLIDMGIENAGPKIALIPATDIGGAAGAYIEGDFDGLERWMKTIVAKTLVAAGTGIAVGTGTVAATPVVVGIVTATVTQIAIDRYYFLQDLEEVEKRRKMAEYYQKSLTEFQISEMNFYEKYLQDIQAEIDGKDMYFALAKYKDYMDHLQLIHDHLQTDYNTVEERLRARLEEYPQAGIFLPGMTESHKTFRISSEKSHIYKKTMFIKSLMEKAKRSFPQFAKNDPVRVSINDPEDGKVTGPDDCSSFSHNFQAKIDLHRQISQEFGTNAAQYFEHYEDDLKERLLSNDIHGFLSRKLSNNTYENVLRNSYYYYECQIDGTAEGSSHNGVVRMGDMIDFGWYMDPKNKDQHNISIKLYLVTDESVDRSILWNSDAWSGMKKTLISEDSINITVDCKEMKEKSYVTSRHRQSDWYCTNRPVIQAPVTLPPIISITEENQQ